MTRWAAGLLALLMLTVAGPLTATDLGAGLLLAQSANRQGGPLIGKDAAAAIARSATGGRVLKVELEREGKHPWYRVKLLIDGARVRVVHVDARSGELRE